MSKIELYESSCGDLIDKVPAGSVDLILTDPPYPKEFLHCWDELAKFADHALASTGELVAMSGNGYLPYIYGALSKVDIKYAWTMMYYMPNKGQAARFWHPRVINESKVVLWYYKNEIPRKNFISDVFHSEKGAKDKSYHHWGQSPRAFANILERFAQTGRDTITVCDPFLGGGTTAIVCQAAGYDFIGADIDTKSIETTRSRLKHDGVQLGMV